MYSSSPIAGSAVSSRPAGSSDRSAANVMAIVSAAAQQLVKEQCCNVNGSGRSQGLAGLYQAIVAIRRTRAWDT